jgi:hypothetical protein
MPPVTFLLATVAVLRETPHIKKSPGAVPANPHPERR